MKTVITNCGKRLYELSSNHDMTLDEALNFCAPTDWKTQVDDHCYYTANSQDIYYDDLAFADPEAIEIAEKLSASNTWDMNLAQVLCELANLGEEWAAADGDTFEQVILSAAEKLHVAIM